MPTFGQRVNDIPRDSKGDILSDTRLTLYASEADATAKANPLGTTKTDKEGRWSFDHSDSVVWVSVQDGETYPLLAPESLNSTYAGLYDAGPQGRNAAAAFIAKNVSDVEDAMLAVFSDSTGAGLTDGTDSRGPWLMAQWIASQFPTRTVVYKLWDDATQGYKTSVTVQTGTGTGNGGGPFTTTILNAAIPGQSPPYFTPTRVGAMLATQPDVVIFSHGHNMSVTASQWASYYTEMVRNVQIKWPQTPMVFVGQNPRTAPNTAADIAQKKVYVRVLRDLAAQEGATYLPVHEAFLADPRGLSALVNATDGTHPTQAGYALWGDEYKRLLGATHPTRLATARVSEPPTSTRPESEIWITPAQMVASTGTPARGVALSQTSAFKFVKNTSLALVSTDLIWIPPHWRKWFLDVIWCPDDAVGGGNVAWNLRASTHAIGAAPTSTDKGVISSAAPAVQGQLVIASWLTLGQDIASSPTSFRIGRDGSNANDTYAGYADLLALRIRRAA